MAQERQRNIQGRMANEAIPTRAPMQDDQITQEWARQQWAAEHCIGGVCWP